MGSEKLNGYIAIHRQIVDWEWYTDIPTKTLFLHILLMANRKDKNHKGSLVKRGQYLTSVSVLSRETGLTTQQVRRALNNLKATSEITIKTTNRNSLINVENYSKYQLQSSCENKQNNEQENKQRTNKEQTNNEPSNNNIKKYNNTQKEKYIKKKKGNDEHAEITEQVVAYLNMKANVHYKPSTKETQRHIHARLDDGYTLEDFKTVIDNKVADWKGTEYEKFLRPNTLFAPSKFESYLNQKSNTSTGNAFMDMILEGGND